jgi:hypothetical protein
MGTKSTPVNSLGVGVYFAKEDCAGILRRLFALVVDLGVLLLVGIVLNVTLAYPKVIRPATNEAKLLAKLPAAPISG